MTDEEKKAIELTNNFIEYFNENIQDGNRADLTVLGEEIEAIKIILNIIQNQQKEIDELKENNINVISRIDRELQILNDLMNFEYVTLGKSGDYESYEEQYDTLVDIKEKIIRK